MCLSEEGDSKLSRNLACRNKGNTGEAVEWDEKLCIEVEAVKEYIYLGDAQLEDEKLL